MVDKINPTNQFHPYQPMDATPHTESPGGLREKLRSLARNHSGMVLGSLAALAIGAGLMRRRSMSR